MAGKHEVKYFSSSLSVETAPLARGNQAVSIFINDDASAPILQPLHNAGVIFLALRSTGYNNVDIEEAQRLKMKVARVPEYSPFAVAEHSVALMLALNLIRSHYRVMEQNFSFDGLVGFYMHGKTVGIIGTGKIGSVVVKIMHGFGCRILAYDTAEDTGLKSTYGVRYTDCETLYKESDIITLHAPFTKATRYLIASERIAKMKRGVMLINTSRGALVCTKDVIEALKAGQIGYFGMDVYEE